MEYIVEKILKLFSIGERERESDNGKNFLSHILVMGLFSYINKLDYL
jgi:hypothetical protein